MWGIGRELFGKYKLCGGIGCVVLGILGILLVWWGM